MEASAACTAKSQAGAAASAPAAKAQSAYCGLHTLLVPTQTTTTKAVPRRTARSPAPSARSAQRAENATAAARSAAVTTSRKTASAASGASEGDRRRSSQTEFSAPRAALKRQNQLQPLGAARATGKF